MSESAVAECRTTRHLGWFAAPSIPAGDHPSARKSVARMASFGVRSGSVLFARLRRSSANSLFERTGANGRERSLAFAMQKVEGSSPFIRSQNPRKAGVFVCGHGYVSPR